MQPRLIFQMKRMTCRLVAYDEYIMMARKRNELVAGSIGSFVGRIVNQEIVHDFFSLKTVHPSRIGEVAMKWSAV